MSVFGLGHRWKAWNRITRLTASGRGFSGWRPYAVLLLGFFYLSGAAGRASCAPMHEDKHSVLKRLRAEIAPMRGLWRDMEADLLRLGITSLVDLRKWDAEALYQAYRALSNHPPDPVLRPCFAALIAFAKTGVATPWWRFLRAEARVPTGGSQAPRSPSHHDASGHEKLFG